MKWKRDPEDFRVRERLRDGYLARAGPWRVYRVTKRKLTSLEAAAALARLAGVTAGEVELAGLKDRQGVTSQYMSIRGGRPVRRRSPELSIEVAGAAAGPISAAESEGNSFRIRLRELSAGELARMTLALPHVRACGVPNYFDEQRFGNLRHAQGWIARELMLGRPESALKALLCAPSPHDDLRSSRFKSSLERAWGDWRACRDVAGLFGAHHSVFEHLRRAPEDFAGAFGRVSGRIKLIHLYAFQSHVWNRAVARYFALLCGDAGSRVWDSVEGPLVFPLGPLEPDPAMQGCFRLPGPGLEDVAHPLQLDLLEDVLAREGLVPDQFRIEGVPGFALKGEDRPLFVQPRRVRALLPPATGAVQGPASALLSFDLPRGAYATLVVRALLASEVKGPLDPDRLDARPRAFDSRRRAGGRGGQRAAEGAKAPRTERRGDGGRGRRRGSAPPRAPERGEGGGLAR